MARLEHERGQGCCWRGTRSSGIVGGSTKTKERENVFKKKERRSFSYLGSVQALIWVTSREEDEGKTLCFKTERG